MAFLVSQLESVQYLVYIDFPKDNLLDSLSKLSKLENLLLAQQQVKTQSLMVEICIGDQVQHSLITFTSLKRPLDTMKEEVAKLELMKRGMGLDRYNIVTMQNALVTDFSSVAGQQLLIFHNPEKIVPLSGNEWTSVQLDQLKVRFEHVELNKFFSTALQHCRIVKFSNERLWQSFGRTAV